MRWAPEAEASSGIGGGPEEGTDLTRVHRLIGTHIDIIYIYSYIIYIDIYIYTFINIITHVCTSIIEAYNDKDAHDEHFFQ